MTIFKPTPRESVEIAHQFMSLLFYHQILDDNGKKINSPYSSYYTFWDLTPLSLEDLDKDFVLKDLIRLLNAIAVSPVNSNFRPTEEAMDMLRQDSIEFGFLFHIAQVFKLFEFSKATATNALRKLEYTNTSRQNISTICNSIIPSFYRFKPEGAILMLDMHDRDYQVLWHEVCNNYDKYARIALRTEFGFNYEFKNTKG